MDYFSVDIITSTGVLCRDLPANWLLVPTTTGQINVLPYHTHLITQVETGILQVRSSAVPRERFFCLTYGICEVQQKKIKILVNVAEPSEEIDAERAQNAWEIAHQKLQEKLPAAEIEKYRRKLKRADIRLQLIKLIKNN